MFNYVTLGIARILPSAWLRGESVTWNHSSSIFLRLPSARCWECAKDIRIRPIVRWVCCIFHYIFFLYPWPSNVTYSLLIYGRVCLIPSFLSKTDFTTSSSSVNIDTNNYILKHHHIGCDRILKCILRSTTRRFYRLLKKMWTSI